MPLDATDAREQSPPRATPVAGATLAHAPQADPSSLALRDKQAFRKGIDQFNTGRFFEAHETWEEVWLRSPEPEKTFLQGIIQIAAAFHHYSRGNTRGARNLLDAGLRRLGNFGDAHRGIALAALRAEAQACLAALAAGQRPQLVIPQIKVSQNE